MEFKKRTVCGGIIITHFKGKCHILCVKQSNGGKWGPPKGGVEGWETDAECAKREIKEETGISIPYEKFKYKTSIMRSTYFIIHIFNHKKHFNPCDKNEIEKVSWIPLDDIPLYNTNRHLKEIHKKIKSIF
jgi:8-oxo-dGTP pyrophosphatase MutT (NUDIX family)